MISWSPETVSNEVKSRLRSHTAEVGDYEFDVPTDLVRQDADYWYVPILPNRNIENKNVFYDVLNQIEDELEQEYHVQMMLVPVAPEK